MSKTKKEKKKEVGKKKKLQLAFYWAASCGGCEIAVLDIDEKILDVVAAADILFWPVAMGLDPKCCGFEEHAVDPTLLLKKRGVFEK